MAAHGHAPHFTFVSDSTLGGRLLRAIGDGWRELASGPAGYLKTAFSLDRFKYWLPIRFFRELAITLPAIILHPIKFFKTSGATEPLGASPRHLFRPILAAIAIIYMVTLSYMAYRGILAPFFGISVVSKDYRKIETATILAPLKYPAQRTQGPSARPELTPEQISERESKRREREEREREEREREERERAEREKAEKEAAERAAREAEKEEEKSAEPAKFGEINDAPIKDIVGKVYALYQAGGLDLKGEDPEFSVMAGFTIDKDGSIPKKSIKILKSSGSKVIDEKAIEILWNIGESHALGPISMLTSNSIRLDLTDRVAKLTITGFAPSSDVAKDKAQELNTLFFLMRLAKRDSDTAELLSGVKIRSDNNRVDAELTVSRARAGEMMRARFGNNQ
jgi:hypothetical protein